MSIFGRSRYWITIIMAKTAIADPRPVSTKQEQPALAKPRSKFFELLINSWIFLPLLPYFKMVNEYDLNLPILDDYDSILRFLNNFKVASFTDKLTLLFEQHNEHRIFAQRLIVVIYYYIAGNINFINLILIANLQLVVIFVVCTIFIKRAIPKYWNVIAFMVGVCLFDMNNYDNADFAMCGIVNYGIIMLFLLSLLLYTNKSNKYLWLAVVLQVTCIFSNGNGMIAAFALVLYTIFTKDKAKIISCAVAFLAFVPLYFINYKKVGEQTALYTTDLSKVIPFFLHLVGGHFGYEQGVLAGVMILPILLLAFPLQKKWKIKEYALPFLCIAAFILASDAVVAFSRSGVKMLDSYSSRYLIYPNILASLTFILIAVRLEGHKLKWPVTICLSIILFYTYSLNYTYGEAGFARYQYRTQGQEYYYLPDKIPYAKNIADRSCQLGIYCIKEER